MPIYSYQCDCGLHFDKIRSVNAMHDPAPCPACEEPVSRLMPETVSGVFVQDVTGPVPQNTGIQSLDAHVDRVIGQSAAQGWAAHRERMGDKSEVLRDNPEAGKHALRQNLDGTWRPLTAEERGVQVRAQKINSLAISAMSRRRRKRPAPVGQA